MTVGGMGLIPERLLMMMMTSIPGKFYLFFLLPFLFRCNDETAVPCVMKNNTAMNYPLSSPAHIVLPEFVSYGDAPASIHAVNL